MISEYETMKKKICRKARAGIEINVRPGYTHVGIKDVDIKIFEDGGIGFEILDHYEDGMIFSDDSIESDDYEVAARLRERIKYKHHCNTRVDRALAWTSVDDLYNFALKHFPNYREIVKRCKLGYHFSYTLARDLACDIFLLDQNNIPDDELLEFKFQMSYLNENAHWGF